MTIRQGHRYSYGAMSVLALESGQGRVRVAPIRHDQPYPLGRAFNVEVTDLKAEPMRYFHGQVPA